MWLDYIHFFSGLIMCEVLRKRGYGAKFRVLMAAITFYIGPIILICLIYLRGNYEKS